MTWQDYAMAVFLGIVEGVTEFLPVSSTGHLILVQDLLGFKDTPGKAFEVIIQLGAILSVVWIYRQKIWFAFRNLLTDKAAQQLAINLTLAFLPSAVLGALAYRAIKEALFSSWVVSFSLILGGVVILIIERMKRATSSAGVEDIPARVAFGIGLFQCISLIPGVSRSAATIMGALLLKVERRVAAEFSFLLAIPTMFAATVYDIYKNWSTFTVDSVSLIAVGFVVSFVTALVVVRWLIRFISTNTFAPFAYYRIALGVVMLTILSFAAAN